MKEVSKVDSNSDGSHDWDKNSRDVFGIIVRKNNHKHIRRLKRQSEGTHIHGNKFWSSACLMIDYLQAHPPPAHTRILEIGCGWGISGVYCAKQYQADVVGLDADASVFAYLDYHAKLNGVSIATKKGRYEQITQAMLADFQMVIASDICFWDEMTKPLIQLIDRCYQAGIQRVLITDPGRQPFREMAVVCAEKYDAIYENWSVPHPYNVSGIVLDIGGHDEFSSDSESKRG